MKVVVLSGYGLNCEEETLFAFMEAGRYLNVGVVGEILHINDLLSDPKQLRQFDVMAVPGGFSYGDDTGAGNVFALRVLYKLKQELQEFWNANKLSIGICNGCQILLRLIFPDVALVPNDVGRYQCRWVRVKVCNDSVWLRGIKELYIPVAHGEGKFYATDSVVERLKLQSNVALRYTNGDKEFANCCFPHNPNGSVYDIAALSYHSGRTLLMMPHPERAVFFTQRYDWTDIKNANSAKHVERYADGFAIFCNAIQYFTQMTSARETSTAGK